VVFVLAAVVKTFAIFVMLGEVGMSFGVVRDVVVGKVVGDVIVVIFEMLEVVGTVVVHVEVVIAGDAVMTRRFVPTLRFTVNFFVVNGDVVLILFVGFIF
jgi:hypothetical protein